MGPKPEPDPSSKPLAKPIVYPTSKPASKPGPKPAHTKDWEDTLDRVLNHIEDERTRDSYIKRIIQLATVMYPPASGMDPKEAYDVIVTTKTKNYLGGPPTLITRASLLRYKNPWKGEAEKCDDGFAENRDEQEDIDGALWHLWFTLNNEFREVDWGNEWAANIWGKRNTY